MAMLAVIMLGAMGSGSSADCNSTPYGITDVGVTAGEIFARATWSGRDSSDEYFKSADGGATWSAVQEAGSVNWASKSAETPSGKYHAGGRDFFLESPKDEFRLAYSMEEISSELDVWMLRKTDPDLSKQEARFRSYSIAYEPVSGNVVAAIGTQGVLVASNEGMWKSVAVGPYFVKRFTQSDYISAMFQSFDFWYVAIFFPLSLTLLSMFLSSPFRTPVLSGPARGKYSPWEIDLRYLTWVLPLSVGMVIVMSIAVGVFSKDGIYSSSGPITFLNFLSAPAWVILAISATVLPLRRKWKFPWIILVLILCFMVATVVVAHLLWVYSLLNADRVVQLVLVICLVLFTGLTAFLILRNPERYPPPSTEFSLN